MSSGLGKVKRSWSGSAHDMQGDNVGVVATKASGSSRSTGQPCAELERNIVKPQDYDYDQEFDDFSITSFTSAPDSQSRSKSSSSSFTPADNVPEVQFIKASQSSVASDAKPIEDQPSHSIEERDTNVPQRRKRQMPASFIEPPPPDHKRSNWSADGWGQGWTRTGESKWTQTAGDLRMTKGERLAFKPYLGGADKQYAIAQPSTSIGPLTMSPEQRVVYHYVVDKGKSLFYTGSAGTGKSVVMREIIKALKRKYIDKPDAVAVTASTGIAACNIGGTTLHSFAGAGLCIEEVPKLVSKIRKNRKAASRWMRTQILIIDEVSMVSPAFLEKLDGIGKTLRRNQKPFGGIQVVMTGDFLQLPPVDKDRQGVTLYAFDAKCWNDITEEKIKLTKVYRQKDEQFVAMLNEVRFGTISESTKQLFKSLSGTSELQLKSQMPATILFPTRMEVERANAMELLKIKRPSHTYDAMDSGTLPPEHLQKQLNNFMAPAKLHLKLGCQVMLIKNTDETLVNGSLGTVVGFLTPAEYHEGLYGGMDWDTIDTHRETEESIRERVSEVYKAYRETELNTEGPELAAESKRTREAERRAEEQIRLGAELADAHAREKRERSRSRSASPERREPQRMPVVRFLLPGGGERRFRTAMVSRESWKNEQPNGEVIAQRTQIPLILSWAMSIHKSQGQTIPLVKIDLAKTFEKGQAYVALSRAVSREGLQVLNFRPEKVKVDARVINWHKDLKVVAMGKAGDV